MTVAVRVYYSSSGLDLFASVRPAVSFCSVPAKTAAAPGKLPVISTD
ncbi:hypothetical protein P9314_21435 [Paenibacillus validus]|uniref:Uncharacterized protein n=1 Tax=Paenibacillus validus TaxID=44253 RepID=A0A7X3CVI6_9BACL|nr:MULTISPECIES: hypothetical protein [Paenibacillus]MED4603189.1 hypothetical protein [Paenibacillus validus]MED4609164.1 hypothetical protein [Paenibacillus validus]MUG73227.1 hypothetical protein [Paenibacillus validus]